MSELERLIEENHRLRAELDAVKRREAALRDVVLKTAVAGFLGDMTEEKRQSTLAPNAGKDLFTREQLLPVVEALQKLHVDLDCISYSAVGEKWRTIPSLATLTKGSINETLTHLRAIGLLDAPLP